FVPADGGRSFDVFLLDLHGGVDHACVLGRRLVPAEPLLPALEGWAAQREGGRFLVSAGDLQRRWRHDHLAPGEVASFAAWCGLLDSLVMRQSASEVKALRHEIEQKIGILQERFVHLALAGRVQGPWDLTSEAELVKTETSSLLEVLGKRASRWEREQEADDVRSLAADPGRGVTALANGVKAVACLRQLLHARHPEPRQFSGPEALNSQAPAVQLLRILGSAPQTPAAERLATSQLGAASSLQVGSSLALEEDWATPEYTPEQLSFASSITPTFSSGASHSALLRSTSERVAGEGQDESERTLLAGPRMWQRHLPGFHSPDTGGSHLEGQTGLAPEEVEDVTVSRARAWLRSRGLSDSTLSHPEDFTPSPLWRSPSAPSLPSRHSTQQLVSASSISVATASESVTSPSASFPSVLLQPSLEPPSSWSRGPAPSSARRRPRPSSAPGGAASERSTSTTSSSEIRRREAEQDRQRARTRAAMLPSAQTPAEEAVRRAQRRARAGSQRIAAEQAALRGHFLGVNGEPVPAASIDIFRRRDERLRRFVEVRLQRQSLADSAETQPAPRYEEVLRDEEEEVDLSFLEAEAEAFTLPWELPQPSPAPEPCPAPRPLDSEE
ncbi:unnamed protein product, partial [Polarella glacialis]